ncbi:hypothetical protein Ahy_B02g057194 [Arachis hypogaea]|uniref:Uncharacterized protein n=1 Tax=Arachis hypogaea TaxID=3818 RepID=A0A445AB56_ARAHY|nr:hypothetical protein Ahy_B02g057194 [Arachis hypogaea]
MELRLVRSCFSEEQLWKPMLQVFEETLTNLSIVKDEGNEKFDLKWKERGSRVSTTCGGVGRDLHASLFQRLSIAFPSEYPSSIPQFGGFEYSSNTGSVFEEPCEAQTLTSQEGLQTPNVSSQRLSVGMTPKTFRLPKPGETLLCPWITVVRDVDIERLLMELRLVRSCFSEEQLWKPMLQVFEETLTNLSIVKDEGNEKFDLKWKERGSRVSTTCGGVGRDLHASLFQRLSIAFPSEYPSSIPQFGGFEYSSNTGSVFEEPCEAQTLTSQEGLQTPNVSSQRLSVGMTPKTFRLPKPGETLLCPWITNLKPKRSNLNSRMEHQISAIRVVRDVDIERLLMELRLVRSCFSEEQLWKPMLQVFEETLTNLSIVKDEGNEKFDLKWKERGSRVSTTCGGVGRDLHASLFQRLSIAFPSEYPSSIPQFGGFEYSSNTGSVFEEPCEAQTLTSQEGLQTPNVSSQRLSVGMTPKTFRLPKPGETLLCPWITFWNLKPKRSNLNSRMEHQISAIRVVRDVDIERLLMELRLVRSCFSEEQLWKPMLQVFEETLTNLSIVKDEGNEKFDLKWKERGSRVSTTCGGVGRDLHASLFQRLSIAFPSEYPSSIPQFGGFEYSNNTGSVLFSLSI